MEEVNRMMTPRLVVSFITVVVSLSLSAITFYYFYATAPFIPLIIGLVGALPMGIIIDDLRRLLKTKKSH